MGSRIKLRRDTASNWAAQNPILQEGELALETDTNKLKIGNGASNWNALIYFGGGGLTEGTNNVKNWQATSTQTVAHGLGARPKFVQLLLECTAANLGYAVGDYVLAHNTQFNVTYDEVNTTISQSNSTTLSIIPKAGGASATATTASWQLRARPFI